ncbi:uncharacterized protein LOC133178457 [Saccostrea echinata]|uniref:uncharacterized protein LOC133178457 n=1 Tax=Saccostrea echinata TaxID=191078 RepID=UPI002A83FB01|nr:uncharacterized protein LOC133178457 [Saccostrea echinata]
MFNKSLKITSLIEGTYVGLRKLKKGLTGPTQLQLKGKEEKEKEGEDLKTDKKGAGALDKYAISSPSETGGGDLNADKDGAKELDTDAISSPSFEKGGGDLNADKDGARKLDKDAISSSLEKEGEDLIADKNGARELGKNSISSPSFEKGGGDLNADKDGARALDKDAISSPFEKGGGDLNADKDKARALNKDAISSPFVSEREEENLNTYKKSNKAAKQNECEDERLKRKKVEFPRPIFSPSKVLLFCLIVLSKIGQSPFKIFVFCLIVLSKIGQSPFKIFVFCLIVLSKIDWTYGDQGSNCVPAPIRVSNPYILSRNESCTTHNVNLQCGNGLILVCLPVVPESDLAVGCAPDICINGKGCPEWNDRNGDYVINVRDNECDNCSDHYRLSNSSEVAKCLKDERALTTKQTTVTSAEVTPGKGTSLEHGVMTTAAPPNKTSEESEGNNEGVIIGASVVGGVFIIVIVAVIKLRKRYRNQESSSSRPDPVKQTFLPNHTDDESSC